MAKTEKDLKLLKNTKISVFVDEALPDILVVTFEFGVKIFKGVLLDSTKRKLPCGVPNINPAFNTPRKNPDDDTLYAVNQRFAYLDPNAQKKKNVQMSAKYKNAKMAKMTVRLRPRQVLCSKCKGICNENSENVSRKRKASEPVEVAPPIINRRRSSNAPVTRAVNSYLGTKRTLRSHEPTLVPKLTRIEDMQDPLEDPLRIDSDDYLQASEEPKKPLSNLNTLHSSFKKHSQTTHSDSSSENSDNSKMGPTSSTQKRSLRKKRSASNFEDSASIESDEKAPCHAETSIVNINNIMSSAKTIKISYGEGEGTILKIPAQINTTQDDLDLEENINTNNIQGGQTKTTNKDTQQQKAARRALKKAKREARKKVLLSSTYLGGASPRYSIGGASPRYALGGGASPRYAIGNASPRQGLGNNSPRYMMPPFELSVPRRRKHKMKHKKKHREDKDRRHKEGEVSSSTQEDSKEQCITQKLSINLRRLNNTYTPCRPVSTEENSSNSSSDEHNEQVPNFPPPNPPLMLRINAQTVSSALGADGVRLLVGDVVWGKIHGFPWWPGKILTITNCNNGAQGPQAHVAWYASPTSSLMQCDQLCHYLENFKVRYNKKKKGPYKEAIKQATSEARENAENRVRQPLGNSPSHNIIPQVVSPALASPREIDVVS